MPKLVTKQQAEMLVKSGKAGYDDDNGVESSGGCDRSFDKVIETLNKLTEKQDDSGGIIAACAEITESLNMYHMTVIEEMAKIDVKPVVDMSRLDEINSRLITVLQKLSASRPKEWSFEIERDMMGEMTSVKATEVTH